MSFGRRKPSHVQRESLHKIVQNKHYAASEKTKFVTRDDRRAEMAAIDEFIKKNGVKRIVGVPPKDDE